MASGLETLLKGQEVVNLVSIPLQGLVASGRVLVPWQRNPVESFNPSPGISGFRTRTNGGPEMLAIVSFNPSPGISGFRTQQRSRG